MTPTDPVARAREAWKAGSEYDAHHFLVAELADLVEQLRAENARLELELRVERKSHDPEATARAEASVAAVERVRAGTSTLEQEFGQPLTERGWPPDNPYDEPVTVVPTSVLAAMGEHDPTGTDHLAELTRVVEENDALLARVADQASVIQRLRAGEVEDVEHLQWVRPDDPADPDTTFTFAPMSEGEAAVLAEGDAK